MRPPARLGQRPGNIHRLNPVTPGLLLLMRYRVRDHDLAQPALVQLLDGVAGQDAVGDDGDGLAGAVVEHHVRGFHQSAARVRHIVHDDGDLLPHVAHEDHAAYLVGAGALFVDEREVEV